MTLPQDTAIELAKLRALLPPEPGSTTLPGSRLTITSLDPPEYDWVQDADNELLQGVGDPNGALNAPISTLYLDKTSGAPKLWQNQDGGSTWTDLTAAGGSGTNYWQYGITRADKLDLEPTNTSGIADWEASFDDGAFEHGIRIGGFVSPGGGSANHKYLDLLQQLSGFTGGGELYLYADTIAGHPFGDTLWNATGNSAAGEANIFMESGETAGADTYADIALSTNVTGLTSATGIDIAADAGGVFTTYTATTLLRFKTRSDGAFVLRGPHQAIASGDLVASDVSFWFDNTPGSAGMKWKGKDSAGTVVTGSF